ncbi:MAG: hypothetical protein LIO49_09230 [Ruminococcus sp.]|nr:hypothetical protein [Ruminococcus sp.]
MEYSDSSKPFDHALGGPFDKLQFYEAPSLSATPNVLILCERNTCLYLRFNGLSDYLKIIIRYCDGFVKHFFEIREIIP